MLGNGQLNGCQQRKAALIQRSIALRRALAMDSQSLCAVAAWLDLGIDVAGKLRTGWSALAPLFSLWHTRQYSQPGLARKLVVGISVARLLAALWERWKHKPRPAAPAPVQRP